MVSIKKRPTEDLTKLVENYRGIVSSSCYDLQPETLRLLLTRINDMEKEIIRRQK